MLTREKESQLERPPLHADHEHAGDGEFEHGSPLLQTLAAPT